MSMHNQGCLAQREDVSWGGTDVAGASLLANFVSVSPSAENLGFGNPHERPIATPTDGVDNAARSFRRRCLIASYD